ncbi:hypothetical protein Tco_0029995 [Tanacetum coccineum]
MATKHSLKCCEELVAVGAIVILLKLIGSITLIDTHGLTQAILLEFIRNKEETYFIAADILRNICSHKKGVERLRGLPSLVKRLHALVENLKKKAVNDKRNLRTVATNEQTEVED